MRHFYGLLTALLVAATLWCVVGCTQRETDIGRGALQDLPVDTFIVLQGTGTDAIMWSPSVSNGRGKSLQVGNAEGFTAFFAMRFNAPAAVPESARVDCMVVRLTRNRIWPESGALDLQVRYREITESWTEDSLVPGTLAGRDLYPEVGEQVFSSAQTSFTFTIPDSLASRWASGDTTTFGLLVEPRSTGTLLDFFSSEAFDTSGSQGPTLEIYGEQWKLVDSVWVDSALAVTQVAEHDAYLATDTLEIEQGRLAISQGIARRAAIYFPIDSVVDANFARVVNHAEFQFYADDANPANLLYSGVGLLYKNGTMENDEWRTNTDSARAGLVAASSTLFDSTDQVLTFDVSSILAHWIAYPDSNAGFQVLATEENGHLTRQIFYGPAAGDADKRPRLKLWLTAQ